MGHGWVNEVGLKPRRSTNNLGWSCGLGSRLGYCNRLIRMRLLGQHKRRVEKSRDGEAESAKEGGPEKEEDCG